MELKTKKYLHFVIVKVLKQFSCCHSYLAMKGKKELDKSIS